MPDLAPHHQAWLGLHPDRSEQWLRDRLADGFQVHHVDGDGKNDAPHNLVLIEGQDHIRMHGGALGDGVAAWRNKQRRAVVKKEKAERKAKPPAIKHVFPTAQHHRENRQFDWDRMHFVGRKLIVGTT